MEVSGSVCCMTIDKEEAISRQVWEGQRTIFAPNRAVTNNPRRAGLLGKIGGTNPTLVKGARHEDSHS